MGKLARTTRIAGLACCLFTAHACRTGDPCEALVDVWTSELANHSVVPNQKMRTRSSEKGTQKCQIYVPLKLSGREGDRDFEHHSLQVTRFSDIQDLESIIGAYRRVYSNRRSSFPDSSAAFTFYDDRLETDGIFETVLVFRCGPDLIEYAITLGQRSEPGPMEEVLNAIKGIKKSICVSER